jgi:hypothetical protein
MLHDLLLLYHGSTFYQAHKFVLLKLVNFNV